MNIEASMAKQVAIVKAVLVLVWFVLAPIGALMYFSG